jgi:hypothetical protein
VMFSPLSANTASYQSVSAPVAMEALGSHQTLAAAVRAAEEVRIVRRLAVVELDQLLALKCGPVHRVERVVDAGLLIEREARVDHRSAAMAAVRRDDREPTRERGWVEPAEEVAEGRIQQAVEAAAPLLPP